MSKQIDIRDLKRILGSRGYNKFITGILEAGANIDEIEAPDAKKTLESIVQVLKSGKDIPDDQVKITPIGGNAKTVRAGYGFIAQVSVDLGQGIVLDGKIKHSKKPGEIDNLLAVER